MSLDPYLNITNNLNSPSIHATNNNLIKSSFLERIKDFASKAFSELVKSFSDVHSSISVKLNEAFSALELKISKFVNSFFNQSENSEKAHHDSIEPQLISQNEWGAASHSNNIQNLGQTLSAEHEQPSWVQANQVQSTIVEQTLRFCNVESIVENSIPTHESSEPKNLEPAQDKETKTRLQEAEAHSETEMLSPIIEKHQMRTLEPLYTNFLVADAQPLKYAQPAVLDDYQESILSSALASQMLSELANEQELAKQKSEGEAKPSLMVANANQGGEDKPLDFIEERNESLLGSVLASQILDQLICEQHLHNAGEQSRTSKTSINNEPAKQQESDQPSETYKIRELESECEKLIPNTDQEQIRKLKPKYEKLTPNAEEEQIRTLEPKYKKKLVADAKQFEEGQKSVLTEDYSESIQSSKIASQELEKLIKHEKTEEAIKELNNLYNSIYKNQSLFTRLKASIPTLDLTGVTYTINQTITHLNPLTYLNLLNKSPEPQVATIKETLVAKAEPMVEKATLPLNLEDQETQQSLANATDTFKELVKNAQDPKLIEDENTRKYEKWVKEQAAKHQAELAAAAKNQPGLLTRFYNYVTQSGESKVSIQKDELQDKILEETNLNKMFDETDPQELIQQQKIREEAIKDLNALYNSTLKNISLFSRFKASIPTLDLTGVTYTINQTITHLNPLTYLNFLNKSPESQVTIKETLVAKAEPKVENTAVVLNVEKQNTQQSLAGAADTLKELVKNAQDPELIKNEKEEKYKKWVSEQVAKYQTELAASAKNQPNVVTKFYQSLKSVVAPRASIIRDTKQDKILEEKTLDKLFGDAEYSKTLTEQITSTIKNLFTGSKIK